MKTIYQNEDYAFILSTREGAGASGAAIVRHSVKNGEDIVILDYNWPAQLTVEVEADEGTLREDGVLCWKLHVTAHHISGNMQGEFTETQYYEVTEPFGGAEEMKCHTVDIVRKTRFAIAERHLKHLPHQTYPSVDGRQGPYGHP